MTLREDRTMNRHERRARDAEQRAAVQRANARLKSEMSNAFDKLDRVIEERVSEVEQESYIPCAKGCAACCDQLISVSLTEAEYIGARYPALVRQAIPELKRQVSRMEDLGIADMVSPFETGEAADRPNPFPHRWFAERIPCALLDPLTKECRIYEARPSACRAHFAMGHWAEVCDARPEPHEAGSYDGPTMTAMDATYIAQSPAGQLLAKIEVRRRGNQAVMGPLPFLLLHVNLA